MKLRQAKQPIGEGTDISSDQPERTRDEAEMSTSMGEMTLDKTSKDLQHSSAFTAENVNEGNSNDIDDPLVRAANKRLAKNKRRRENYKRNQYAAKLKATKATPLRKVFIPTTAQREERAELLEKATEPALRLFDNGRLKQNPELLTDRGKDLGSVSANVERHVLIVEKVMSNEMRRWDELGAKSWEGYEEDDVEGDSPTELTSIKLEGSPGKGIGVFALRNVKKGAEIFRESAVIEEKTRAQSWLHAEALFHVLSKGTKNRLLLLTRYCACEDTEAPCVKTTLEKIWNANRFQKESGEKAGKYLFSIAACINHDCRPSSYFRFTKEGHIVFYAARGIRKGEEITYGYLNLPGPAELRRSILIDKYGFVCQCSACVDDVVLPATHASQAVGNRDIEVEEVETLILDPFFTPEETNRKTEALSWADSTQAKLDKARESQLQFCAGCAVDVTPPLHQIRWWSQMLTKNLKRDLLEENSMYMDEDVLERYIDSLVPHTTALVESLFKDVKQTTSDRTEATEPKENVSES
ncbi:hypothetical protein VTL71DRAFT_12418 [Oculimacula yallundae]|uniref:SET domain-containing protein n=1 Tax=Oculimacula yallundae TaxID=86028 RepID=A0ABR4CPB5_9HELO